MFSSSAKSLPVRGLLLSMLLMADTKAIILKIKVNMLRATVPMMKPSAEASMVLPNPRGLVVFEVVGVVSMIFNDYSCCQM